MYKDWLAKMKSEPLKLEALADPCVYIDFEELNSKGAKTTGKASASATLATPEFNTDNHLTKRDQSQAFKLDSKDFIDLGQKGDF